MNGNEHEYAIAPDTARNKRRGALCLLVYGILAVAAALPAAAWDECLVLTSDFGAFGGVASLERYSPWTVAIDLTTTSGDAVARYHDELYYIVNRGGASNLQIVDPAAGYATVDQYGLGAGRNPQDIAFAPDGTAYVSCYDDAVLLHLNVDTGSIIETFSTASFADADGFPETSWMQAVGNLLYVSCQRLDRANWYLPVGDSYLLVFDMAAESWVDVNPGTPQTDGIALVGTNPYSRLELAAAGTRLRVACNGVYGLLDGGVEHVNLTTRTSLGFEISEASLGGDVLDVTTVSDQLRYVIVSDSSFHSSLRKYVPGTSNVTVVDQAAGYYHSQVLFDGGAQLFVADRTPGVSGIRVFNATSGNELTSSPVSTGQPPTSIVLPVETDWTAAPSAPRRALLVHAPWPNPCNPATRVEFVADPAVDARVGVFDLRGSLITSAAVTTSGDGTGTFHFDGRDRHGQFVPAGCYRVVVTTAQEQASTTFSLVK